MTDLAKLRTINRARWLSMKFRPERKAEFAPVAKRLCDPVAKVRYQVVEKVTGVPWWFIAVVHQRECSQSWGGSLAQGDPWDRVSIHVPKGRGPFRSWQDAAVDALTNCPPYAARNKDWSPGGALTMLERYNGLAYANHGVPSPYVWSGSDQYSVGKVLVDHGPIEPVVDRQLGCAPLLAAMAEIDPSVTFAAPPVPAAPVKEATGIVVAGAAGAAVAVQSGGHPWIAGIIIAFAIAAAVGVAIWRARK